MATLFALVGLSLIAYAIATYNSTSANRIHHSTAAAQAVLDGGHALAADVEHTVSYAMARTRLLATNPETQQALLDGDQSRLQILCNQMIQDATEIDAVALFDDRGAIKAINTFYADRTPIPQFRIDDVMSKDLSGVDVISDCLTNNATQEALEFQTRCDITPALFGSSGLSVAHSVPVTNPKTGQLLGVVSIRMRFERIAQLASNMEIAGGLGALYFVTDSGQFFDERINAGEIPPPIAPEELTSLVEPLVRAKATYTIVQRLDQYLGLFRVSALETLEPGGIQILVMVDADWVNREADLVRVLYAGIPASLGILFLFCSGLVWSIQQSRRSRLELEASEDQFRSLANNIPGVSFRCIPGTELNMLYISKSIEMLTGYPASDFLKSPARSLRSIVLPEYWSQVNQAVADAVDRTENYKIEYQIHHVNGSIRWIRERGQVVRPGGNGEPVIFLDGTLFDFTEQLNTEQLLAAERTRLSAFVRHAPAAVAMFDRQVQYVAASERWYTDYKLEGQEIIGRSHYDVFPDCPQVWKDIHRRCLEGAVERSDSDTWRPPGWVRDQVLRWEIRPWYDQEGDVAGIMMFTQDITADKELEATLEEKNASLLVALEKLDEARLAADAANQAKSEFLANMSHEIRTPLTAILGYADMLLEVNDEESPAAPRVETVETIRKAGRHLLVVINDILDLSKIEAGKIQFESVPFSLSNVLLELDNLMRLRAEERGVKLSLHFDTPVPENISGDPTRIRQILMNLVGNATKFTTKGTITIGVSAEMDGELCRLQFAIEDTGPGMVQSQAAKLFEPFTQIDNSSTRKHGGTGLGLTISRRLSQLMGGDVELDWTEPGKGSRFIFRTPVNTVKDTSMMTQLIAAKPLANTSGTTGKIHLDGRILVAEDNAVNQRLISFHLKKAGAQVALCLNGVEALAQLQEASTNGEPFDLLVTDIQMPEMDGYTLARSLREGGAEIPIIALTAHAMAEDRNRCIESGCNDYVTKPIDKVALLSMCQKWIRKHGE